MRKLGLTFREPIFNVMSHFCPHSAIEFSQLILSIYKELNSDKLYIFRLTQAAPKTIMRVTGHGIEIHR